MQHCWVYPYEGRYDRQYSQLQEARQPQLYRTAYASPQLELWELDEEQWHKVREVPIGVLGRRKPQGVGPIAEQLRLQA
jgi:hypothetical protein